MDLSPALTDLKNKANALRSEVKGTCLLVKGFKSQILNCPDFPPLPVDKDPDKSEALACVMLAYRHLEDARMRLGKVIQAIDGGRSVYDPPQQQG